MIYFGNSPKLGIVEDPGPRNVKNRHFGIPPFKQNFPLFYLIIHCTGSMKPDIAIKLSLANIHVTVCLLRYQSFS